MLRDAMLFEGPFWNAAFTAIGAAVLWCREDPKSLKVYYLGDLVDKLPGSATFKYFAQFVVFVSMGTLIGLALTQPINPQQSITAGLAWTTIFARRL